MDKHEKDVFTQERIEAIREKWVNLAPQERDEAFKKLFCDVKPTLLKIYDEGCRRSHRRFIFRISISAAVVIAAIVATWVRFTVE